MYCQSIFSEDHLIHYYLRLAELPWAARVNLQPAEHLLFCKQFSKTCPSAYRVQAPQAQSEEGAGAKPAPKPSLDSWGCACKISLRSVQGFGFLFALHIPTDRQTNKCLYAHLYMYRYR